MWGATLLDSLLVNGEWSELLLEKTKEKDPRLFDVFHFLGVTSLLERISLF